MFQIFLYIIKLLPLTCCCTDVSDLMSNQLPNRVPGKAPVIAGFGVRLSDRQTITQIPIPDTPTTHMVVQFKGDFKDEESNERRKLLKGKGLEAFVAKPDERIHLARDSQERISKFKEIATSHPKDGIKSPTLVSTFVLPKVYTVNQPQGYESVRNMLGRGDVECQSEYNLTKRQLDGLSEYQKWTNDEVEPFLKVTSMFFIS